MSLESYLCEQKLDKVIGQRNELALLLKKVLYALAMGWSVSLPEGKLLYTEAADYLKGLRND
jgi:hypothetical protein